jgi:hypothetical protein
MKLSAFYRAIGPFLRGQATHEDAVRDLYQPEARRTRDAARLAIYGRFCRLHRFEVLDSVFPYGKQAVGALRGEEAWEDLVERYFRAHPMKSFELNENGACFPEFLAGDLKAMWPAWLPELLDFEWWEWQTQIAPDDALDMEPDRGPLRLGATVEARQYNHDLLGWLDQGRAGPAPEAKQSLVLFWRDRDLCARREPASMLEMLVMKMVSEGQTIGDVLAQGSGLPRAALEDTLADLRQAGIVLGLE